MFLMGAPGEQCNLHIRDRRSGKHASVFLFLQMGENQPLPVAVQNILAARREKLQAASRLTWLQKQMYLRIVAQRLKMSHALHRRSNCFLIYNVSGAEVYCYMEPFPDQPFQNLDLHIFQFL